MNTFAFQPNVYSAVAVGASTLSLTYSNLFSQRQILCRNIHSFYLVVVSAAGHTEETAHLTDTVSRPMAIDYLVFDAGFHSFPVSERKSRRSSTSILSRLFSYLYSCKVLAGLRPLCFGIPGASLRPSRLKRFLATSPSLKPSFSAI